MTSEKKVLRISLDKISYDAKVRIELETFSAHAQARNERSRELLSFDKKELLQNNEFVRNLGFCMTGALLMPETRSDWSDLRRTFFVYPDHKGKSPILKVRSIPYDQEPKGKICCKLDLKNFDAHTLKDDDEFTRQIGQCVIEHLPISEELCFQKVA